MAAICEIPQSLLFKLTHSNVTKRQFDPLLGQQVLNDFIDLSLQDLLGYIRPYEVEDNNILANSVEDLRPTQFQFEIVFDGLADPFLDFFVLHINGDIWFSFPKSIPRENTKVTGEDNNAL